MAELTINAVTTYEDGGKFYFQLAYDLDVTGSNWGAVLEIDPFQTMIRSSSGGGIVGFANVPGQRLGNATSMFFDSRDV